MKSQLILATALTSILALSACGPTHDERRAEVRRVSPPGRDIQLIDTAPAVKDASVNFITGGVGDDDRAEIEAAKGQYNLHVTNARTDGAFVENLKTIVYKKNGKAWDEVLNVTAGPLLYVQLEPGTYQIESSRYDVTQKKQVVIGKTSRDISFQWKPLADAGQY